ncbi:MAG: DNA internalization-related competence protein ComEC/Rec2 [Oscillibacter sp.]|nr:DNA internalization-related competence protein ComEC/Rec2 [Oscillibacter sp.]
MRILALFCGAFSAGIFLAQYLIPQRLLLSCAVAGFLLACTRFLLPGDTGKRVLLIGVGLSLAFGYDWLYLRQTVDSLSGLYGTQQAVSVTLCDYAEPTAWGARVSVKMDGVPGQAVYYGKSNLLELRPGTTLRDTVRFEDARHIRENDITAFTSRGVFALAYGRGVGVAADGADTRSMRWWPVRTGQAMREQIRTLFPGDVAPFLCGLLTGDRTGLAVSPAVDISETGLSHVLAVSGMHCGFLIALLGFLLRNRSRVAAAAVEILTLVFYALLTGAKPSVIRACIMLSLLLIAPLVRRERDSPTALCAALFLILLQNPFAAASVSLQLSFACVAGLLSLTPKLYNALRGGASQRVRNFVAASLAASAGVIAFTAPLCAVYFGALALIMPLSNLLCLWAVGAAFVSGMSVTALAFVCTPLAAALAWIPALLVRYILFCAHILAKVPLHAVYFANPFLKYWLVHVYLLFALARILKRSGVRLYLLSALLSCATLVVTLRLGQSLYHSNMDALALDVGQGQSIVLASRGRFALVDCGSSNRWKDPGTVAGQMLLSMGCHRLDALILTHFDSDHVNGVETLLARLGVKALYVPGAPPDDIAALAERYRIPVHIVRERAAAGFGVGQLVLFPPVGAAGSNDLGLSILASAGDTDLLITGDMGQDAERLLLRRYTIPDLEAYIVGHHGSKYSTSDELLSALTPETACVSVGSNSYGHPAPETLQRLSEHRCAVYRTDLDGTIHLHMNPSSRQSRPSP